MYEYQRKKVFFAQIADDLKELAVKELSEFGAMNLRPDYRGIYFKADHEALYRINYSTRLASRILAPLISFDCKTTDQLYRKAKQIKWTDFFDNNNTFAVFSNVSDSEINNSHYASLCLKDGIVDSFQKVFGERPNIDTKNPDLWLNLYIRKDKAIISLDTSGGSLHKRGYRKEAIVAPMQETVAAAVLKHIEWDGTVPLYDPMCGSGTLLSEALMHYCNIPSGFYREQFGFEFLPDFDPDLWENLQEGVDQQIRPLPEGYIAGSDVSSKAVEISKNNFRNLKFGNKIKLQVADFNEIETLNDQVIVTNPPYGIRMGEGQNLDLFYKSFGDFLKQKCKGSTAYIYFGEREFIKKIGLKASWKKVLKTGGLDGRLAKYELF